MPYEVWTNIWVCCAEMKRKKKCTELSLFIIYRAYIGTIPIVTITDLELVKLVAIKDSDNFINRPVSHIIIIN